MADKSLPFVCPETALCQYKSAAEAPLDLFGGEWGAVS